MQDYDERLRQAIRAGGIGIFEHDHDANIIYWSLELRQMYGWDADEPATLPKILSHVHPDDANRVVAAVRWAHNPDGDGAFDIEHRIFDRAGRLHWVLTRSRTYFQSLSGQLRPVRTIGAVQDVTERRTADERLRVLDTVLSSSAQAIAVAGASGTLTFANSALARLWGYADAQALLGRSIFELWKGPDAPAVTLDRVREHGILELEMPATRVDGSLFHLGLTAEAVCDAKGALTQVLVTFTDITQSKRVRDTLHLKDQAIASSLIGIVILDASGAIIYANPEFLRLWSIAREDEALGRQLWECCDPPSRQLVTERIAGGGAFQGEIVGRRADGTTIDLNVSARALLGADGELVNVVASFADVTDRKRLEAQLAHAQKMESIGRLAGGIAHDFNNFLTVISLGLELSLSGLPPNHPARRHLAAVAEAATSAAALTRQLLAFSRKQIIAPKVLDLNEVIRRVEKMILPLLGAEVELATNCAQNLMPICADPGQVEQIMMNLAINARDAMASGGRLAIQTSNIYLDEEYARLHVDTRPGAYVLLQVSDTGAGMRADVRAHLFEPFFTTKEPGKGTGLGLAMVYGAVRQNGGLIEVYSEIGMGTTFKIYLPAASAASPPPPARVATRARARPASILLVDDDKRVRTFATNVLTRFGHTIHTFANGEEALAALSALSPTPELLVTDVIMSGMNGRALAERVAASLPNILVLFVSGYPDDIIIRHGILQKGIEFLAKPYTVEQLTRRVSEVLENVASSDVLG